LLRILALVRKELLAILKDPRGQFTLIAPPIVQCLIYGYAATFDLNDVPYVVLDRDRSSASHALLAKLDGSNIFHRAATVEQLDELKQVINRRQALVAIQIDRDFERKLMQGAPAEIQVIADGRNSNTAGTALSYVATIVDDFNASWRTEQQMPGPLVRVTTRAWFNPNLETRWYMIPALIGTLTLLQTLLLTAMSVAREREQGTFDQLLVTPFRPAEIMIGKALPSVLVGLVQAANVLLVAQLYFHIPFAGSFVTLFAGVCVFLLAAVGIGLLVSSMVATMQQAMLFSFLIMMPFALLSGLATPLSSMPKPMQWFTLINPLRYAIDMAQRIYLEGAGLYQLLDHLIPMAVIAVITLAAAAYRFSQRLG
jgi:ABC-2 type transport system permease protein